MCDFQAVRSNRKYLGGEAGRIYIYIYINTHINWKLMQTGYSQQTRRKKNKQLIRAFWIIVIYTVHHLQVLQKWKITIIITSIQRFIFSPCNWFRIISFLVVIQKACQGVSTRVWLMHVPKTSQNAIVFYTAQWQWLWKNRLGFTCTVILVKLSYIGFNFFLIHSFFIFFFPLSFFLLKYICVCWLPQIISKWGVGVLAPGTVYVA